MLFLLAWDSGFLRESSLWFSCIGGDLALIPGLGRSPREGKATPPVFWPREFHGQYSPQGCKESDMTEWISFSLSLHGFGGRKTAEMECPFYHMIQSTCLIPGNVDLDHLAEVVFVRLFHCQVTLFLPLHIVVFFWNEVTMCNSFLRNRELHSTSLTAQLPKSIAWNSSAWEIGLFSHMYSIIYLYQYGPMLLLLLHHFSHVWLSVTP